ncbi:MAG: hypothetical protein ABSB13_15645 [Candidatus Binatus sp.]|jgi:hypothetical protein|uniref:hypothetical protein n=1 Tax=Candidatus Binatus sp. TaxID=2811406 RepID=UPI003D1450AA
MPVCRQCGKDNAEGMAFCGYCAAPLARPAVNPVSPPPKPSGNPGSSPPLRGLSPQPKPFKPEMRSPVIHTPGPPPPSNGGEEKAKGGFQWIPWSETSRAQRAGRAIAAGIVLLLILFLARGMLRGLGGAKGGATGGSSADGFSAQTSGVPVTEGDRRDGIESLCKVFQIYGLPKNDHDAAEAAHNAAELFKLAGNQSPERSTYILTTIAHEFRSGKLSGEDCAQAGAPIATTQNSTDDSTPGATR